VEGGGGSGRQSCVGAGHEAAGTGLIAIDLGGRRWRCVVRGRGGCA
jgi:hypothetical protein